MDDQRKDHSDPGRHPKKNRSKWYKPITCLNDDVENTNDTN